MNNLPNTEVSPRIVNGVLRWYAGDTFDIQIEIDLKDQDDEPITIGPDDTVEVVFKDKSLDVVKTFEFNNIEDNTVTLEFDETCTALFPAGKYTYDVYYTGEKRTTIANDNKVLVE